MPMMKAKPSQLFDSLESLFDRRISTASTGQHEDQVDEAHERASRPSPR